MCEQRKVSRMIHRLDLSIGRYLCQHLSLHSLGEEMSGTNARIIRYLSANQDHDIYQKDVEKEFGITRSTASRVLVLMEQKGLIIRSGVEHDARLKKLTLTEKALHFGEMMRQNGRETDEQLLTGFSQEEKEQLFSFLERMSENVK